MLDVAAVAERLIRPFRFSPQLEAALILLTALHDLGKISATFRAMLIEGQPQRLGRHWEITEVWLTHLDPDFGERLGSHWQRRAHLYAAVAGHHGRPPARGRDTDFPRMLALAGDEALADVARVVTAFSDHWPEASLSELGRGEALRLSWWLPGFVAAAD
jgi:CRISPR-associated endonuclease/helicase Cas3